MKNKLQQFFSYCISTVITGFWFTTSTALAALPKVEDPSKGKGKGIMDTVKNYVYDYISTIGLVVCAIGFIVVVINSLATYREIQTGRKTWTDLGMMAGVGAILIVIVIWLLTQSTESLT